MEIFKLCMLLLLSAHYMLNLHLGEIKEKKEISQVRNNYKTGHTSLLHQLALEFSSHLIKITGGSSSCCYNLAEISGGFMKLLLSCYQNRWRLHQVATLIRLVFRRQAQPRPCPWRLSWRFHLVL